jgi:hypothetical protein
VGINEITRRKSTKTKVSKGGISEQKKLKNSGSSYERGALVYRGTTGGVGTSWDWAADANIKTVAVGPKSTEIFLHKGFYKHAQLAYSSPTVIWRSSTNYVSTKIRAA